MAHMSINLPTFIATIFISKKDLLTNLWKKVFFLMFKKREEVKAYLECLDSIFLKLDFTHKKYLKDGPEWGGGPEGCRVYLCHFSALPGRLLPSLKVIYYSSQMHITFIFCWGEGDVGTEMRTNGQTYGRTKGSEVHLSHVNISPVICQCS